MGKLRVKILRGLSPRQKRSVYHTLINDTHEQSKAWQGNGRETRKHPIVVCHLDRLGRGEPPRSGDEVE
jgi:hypothetical protein